MVLASVDAIVRVFGPDSVFRRYSSRERREIEMIERLYGIVQDFGPLRNPFCWHCWSSSACPKHVRETIQ